MRVDTGYFITGDSRLDERRHARVAGRRGRRPRRSPTATAAFRASAGPAACARSACGAKERAGVSVGTSEHFALPRVAPGLREVNAYLGWFGPASRAMQAFSAGAAVGMKVPGAARLWDAATARFVKGSTGGPDAEARAKCGLARGRDRLRRRGTRALRGARVGRGRLHVHGQDPGLGCRAGGRGRAAGSRARSGRPTASASTRWWTGCRQAGIAEEVAGSSGRPATEHAAAG